MVLLPQGKLVLNVLLLVEARLEFQDLSVQSDDRLLALVKGLRELVDLQLILAPLLLHFKCQALDLLVFFDPHLFHLSPDSVQVSLVLIVQLLVLRLKLSLAICSSALNSLEVGEVLTSTSFTLV